MPGTGLLVKTRQGDLKVMSSSHPNIRYMRYMLVLVFTVIPSDLDRFHVHGVIRPVSYAPVKKPFHIQFRLGS